MQKVCVPQIIILITQITTCSPPLFLSFIFLSFFLDVSGLFSFYFFFFFWIGLVLGGGGRVGVLGFFYLFSLRGEFLACFLTVKTTFAPSLFPSFPFSSCLRFCFILCTSNREEIFFVTRLGGLGIRLGGKRSCVLLTQNSAL